MAQFLVPPDDLVRIGLPVPSDRIGSITGSSSSPGARMALSRHLRFLLTALPNVVGVPS
jgi:hypothetical protein